MVKVFFILSLLVLISCNGTMGTNANTGSVPPENSPGGVGYQLNATLAELQSLDPSFIGLTMSNNDQTASLTWIGASQAGMAAPANLLTTPQTLDLSTGKKAFECEYSVPAGLVTGYAGAGTVGNGILTCVILGLPFSPLFMAEIMWFSDGTYDVTIRKGVTLIYSENVSHSNLPSRIGFEFDATAQTVSVYLDNDKKVLSDNTYTPQPVTIFMGLTEPLDQANILNAGKVSTMRLITTAGDMTTNFSAGTTDPFGDPL